MVLELGRIQRKWLYRVGRTPELSVIQSTRRTDLQHHETVIASSRLECINLRADKPGRIYRMASQRTGRVGGLPKWDGHGLKEPRDVIGSPR